MNRVMPASTRTSIIASADWMPDCGRASGWLSTLTPMTRRSISAPSGVGMPFNKDGGPVARVVVVVVVVVRSSSLA